MDWTDGCMNEYVSVGPRTNKQTNNEIKFDVRGDDKNVLNCKPCAISKFRGVAYHHRSQHSFPLFQCDDGDANGDRHRLGKVERFNSC